MKQYIILIIFLIAGLYSIAQQRYDYQTVFGEKYKSAVEFVNREKWLGDTLSRYQIDPNFAISIVFPELIRYSALLDYVESRDIAVLYVQFGKEYSDFSIGRFQMKPSFAERIEADFNRLFTATEKTNLSVKPFNLSITVEARKSRVERLNNLCWQVKYLILFIKIMEKKYPAYTATENISKLQFYATAYNTGYYQGVKNIINETKRKRFHTEIIRPDTLYNYSTISIYHYNIIR